MSEIENTDSNAVIGAPTFEETPSEKLELGSTDSGVIGLTPKKKTVKKAAVKKEPKKAKGEKVAIFSERNISWSGVGSLEKGYNIVTKEASEQWLTRPRVRLVEPEEIAREFEL